jgi:hypothetical protein
MFKTYDYKIFQPTFFKIAFSRYYCISKFVSIFIFFIIKWNKNKKCPYKLKYLQHLITKISYFATL